MFNNIMQNISMQEPREAETSTMKMIKELQDAITAAESLMPKRPYTGSDPIPTELLHWSPRK